MAKIVATTIVYYLRAMSLVAFALGILSFVELMQEHFLSPLLAVLLWSGFFVFLFCGYAIIVWGLDSEIQQDLWGENFVAGRIQGASFMLGMFFLLIAVIVTLSFSAADEPHDTSVEPGEAHFATYQHGHTLALVASLLYVYESFDKGIPGHMVRTSATTGF